LFRRVTTAAAEAYAEATLDTAQLLTTTSWLTGRPPLWSS
jgi:hypothetical protein